MTNSHIYLQLREVLDPDGPTAALLQRASSGYVTWEEFASQELPNSMSPVAAWNIVQMLRECAGIKIPIPDLLDTNYWYARTYEIGDNICRIQRMCTTDSDLYRQLHETVNRAVLVRSRVEETVAAALLDGLAVSVPDANEMLMFERSATTPNEQLIWNTLNALDNLEDLVNEPFSPELLDHLTELVLHDVDVDGIEQTKSRLGILEYEYSPTKVAAFAERQKRYIIDYANHDTGDVHDHPVFRALLLPDMFRLYRPLPHANSQVGRLVFRLYTLKMGLPVLGMLPLSRIKLHWEQNEMRFGIVTLTPTQYMADRAHQGRDLTGYATLSMQFALAALLDLQIELTTLEMEDRQLRMLLQRDPELNHRQRSILGRALRNPDSEFRIAYHKSTHNVVYATARADLLQLVERGYLTIGKNGRAMVFRPRKDLHDFVQRGHA